jgi:GNAT superfamily N-acetyltransferase
MSAALHPTHRLDAAPAAQPVIVRPVEAADIPDLLRLLRAKAAFDGAADALRATEDKLAHELLAPNAAARAIVAVADGRVVGMATYFQTFSSFLLKPGLWLDDLFVDEAYRQQGVGRHLMIWLCREAESRGCVRIDWIVAANNENGRGFYERMGATIFEGVRLARIDEHSIRAHALGA